MLYPITSPECLNEIMNDPAIVILDASQKTNISGSISDYENLQIKNARYFDIDNVFSDTTSNLPHMLPTPEKFQEECRNLGLNNDSKIIVYDNIGVYSSPRAWWMFKVMGYDNVSILNGGLPAWIKEGFETESVKIKNFTKGNFESCFNPKLVKNANDIKENLQSKKALVIDARSEGRFNGTEPEPREGLKSGHIANSVNIPFNKVLDNEKFKSENELKKLFNSLKIKNQPLIFSCGSGMTACILFVAFELCIDNVKSVYDGSWTEWTQL